MNVKTAIAVAAAVLVVFSGVTYFWLGPTIWQENRQAGEQIARDQINKEAVQDYRWFRAQWYDIKSQREKLDNYQAQHKRFHETWQNGTWKENRDARVRHGRIQDRITGTRNMISSMLAEYNARRSDATRAIFTCGLPYRVDEKLFIADGTGVEYTSQEAKLKEAPEDPSECRFASAPDEASNETG